MSGSGLIDSTILWLLLPLCVAIGIVVAFFVARAIRSNPLRADAGNEPPSQQEQYLRELNDRAAHALRLGGVTPAIIYRIVELCIRLGGSERDILHGLSRAIESIEVPEKQILHGVDVWTVIKWTSTDVRADDQAKAAIKRWWVSLETDRGHPLHRT